MTVTIFKKHAYILVTLLFAVTYFFSNTCIAKADFESAYFKSPTSALAPKSEFYVEILLDQSRVVNAIDFEIAYPPDKLKFLGIDDSNSIVTIWKTKEMTSLGSIVATGAIFPPFSGKGGAIFKIKFRTLTEGDANIAIKKSDTFLSDGSGTRIVIPPAFAKIVIKDSAPKAEVVSSGVTDSSLPEFTLSIVKDPVSKNNLIFYQVSDKESGIRIVEIRINNNNIWSEWRKANNPEVYDKWVDSVELRAINNNDLETVKTVQIESAGPPLWVIVCLVIIGFSLVLVFIFHKRVKHLISLV